MENPDDTNNLFLTEAQRIIQALNEIEGRPLTERIDFAMKFNSENDAGLYILLEQITSQMKVTLDEINIMIDERDAADTALGAAGLAYNQADISIVGPEEKERLRLAQWDAIRRFNRAEQVIFDKFNLLDKKLKKLADDQEKVLLKLGIVINPSDKHLSDLLGTDEE